MEDKEYLLWLVDRMVLVYHESPNVDFVHKLRAIALKTRKGKDTNWAKVKGA
jgi:hypothetical protein